MAQPLRGTAGRESSRFLNPTTALECISRNNKFIPRPGIILPPPVPSPWDNFFLHGVIFSLEQLWGGEGRRSLSTHSDFIFADSSVNRNFAGKIRKALERRYNSRLLINSNTCYPNLLQTCLYVTNCERCIGRVCGRGGEGAY